MAQRLLYVLLCKWNYTLVTANTESDVSSVVASRETRICVRLCLGAGLNSIESECRWEIRNDCFCAGLSTRCIAFEEFFHSTRILSSIFFFIAKLMIFA